MIDQVMDAGSPVLKGSHVAVEHVLERMAEGWTEMDLLQQFPQLTHDDILACFGYAAALIHAEKLHPLLAQGDAKKMLEQERDRIIAIAERHGGHNVRVMGTPTGGDAVQAASLDLLVKMAPNRSLLDIVGIQQDIEDLLGCTVHVITEGELNPQTRDRIVAEAKSL